MKFEVTILGSSSATPVHHRNPSAQLLNCNEKFFLIDCGEGTQHQMIRFGLKMQKIDHILISHLHGDHYLGLVGMLSTMHLYGRTRPMKLFGPAPLLEIIEVQLKYSDTVLRYPLEFYPTNNDRSELIYESNDLIIETIILNHRIPCTGFKFTQKERLRRINLQEVQSHNVPSEYFPLLKRGQNVNTPTGETYLFEEFTTPADKPRSYAYCSDTLYCEQYMPTIKGCDTIYHEATFLNDMLDRANETHHTTALQAGEVALRSGAHKLLIGHFSSRYKELAPLLDEARTVFQNTFLAIEGTTFKL